jgi:hypothetical protein
MILMRILPGVLKELVRHVPTVLFEAVDWSVLAQEIPKLSRRMIQKEGYSELFIQQQQFLRPFDIELTSATSNDFSIIHNKAAAEKILTLYFTQLFSPHGLFLDLRSNHFEMNASTLLWHPSSLWTKFSDTFFQGLSEIYDGFYLQNDELFDRGLINIGLCSSDWPASDREELNQLFKGHFGPSVNQEMIFDLENFKSSLIKITHFLLEKKVRMSTDFLYLGIYLITMYSSLEESRVRLNVKDIYLNVRKNL